LLCWNQDQPTIVHFAPGAHVALTEFDEEDWTVIAMPVDGGNFLLPRVNSYERFWVIDAETKKATYINPAYEIITGRTCQSLIEEPSSYEEAIHPDDRAHVLAKLERAAQNRHFDERFRIVRPDGEIRWVWVRGFPRKDPDGKVTRVGGTALDVTALKQAEDQVQANLARANSAWSEAEALRKATLALTEDLHMDSVLDALLCSLAELVPYTCARVLVPEGGPHWLALGEKSFLEPGKKSPRCPLTFVADESPVFQRIWSERKRILIPDTKKQQGWQTFAGHQQFRSWLSVPLVASEEFLGFLSVGHIEPNHFTEDHLRRAELLAIPAAVAIQKRSPLFHRRNLWFGAGEAISGPAKRRTRARSIGGRPPGFRREISEDLPLQPGCVFDYDARGRPFLGSQCRVRSALWLLPPGRPRTHRARTKDMGRSYRPKITGSAASARRSNSKCNDPPPGKIGRN
jgi:PAS domain S-box-containing protein